MASIKASERSEIGSSGTVISSGVIIGEEYNPNLSGKTAIRTYERMRRSDPTVRQSMAAIKEPIIGADYRVDAASEEDKDQEVAELVDFNYNLLKWKKTLREILTQLEFGYSLFEMVFEPMVVNGTPRIVLTKLGFRKQTTIAAWVMENGQPGVTQRTADGKTYNIPEYKLARFTINQEGDNYEGMSLLRTAYKPWTMKDKLERIDVVGQERHAVGVMDITYPAGWTVKNHPDEIKAARQAAKNLRANQSSYVDHPEGITFAFMNMQGGTLKDINPSIDRNDRAILRNVLAQFLELGGSVAGSRATSEDHSKLFEQAVQTVADDIVEVMNDVVWKTLVDLNFSDVADYPRMSVGKISDDDMQVMSNALKLFVDAGLLHPTPDDEKAVRKMSNLPEPSDEELDAAFEQPAAPPVTTDSKKATALKAAVAARHQLTEALYGDAYAAAA